MKQLAFWLMLMSSFTDKEAGLDKAADMAELGPQPTPRNLPVVQCSSSFSENKLPSTLSITQQIHGLL